MDIGGYHTFIHCRYCLVDLRGGIYQLVCFQLLLQRLGYSPWQRHCVGYSHGSPVHSVRHKAHAGHPSQAAEKHAYRTLFHAVSNIMHMSVRTLTQYIPSIGAAFAPLSNPSFTSPWENGHRFSGLPTFPCPGKAATRQELRPSTSERSTFCIIVKCNFSNLRVSSWYICDGSSGRYQSAAASTLIISREIKALQRSASLAFGR